MGADFAAERAAESYLEQLPGARTVAVADNTDDTTARVKIEVTQAHRHGSVNLVAKRGDETIAVTTCHVAHAESVHKFAKKAGVADHIIHEALQEATGSTAPVDTAEPVQAPPSGFAVLLRGLHERKGQARTVEAETPLAALQAALSVTNYVPTEPVIEWDGTSQLAVVDLDYHNRDVDRRPDHNHLELLARLVRPRPAMFWYTHGRGLRLVYAAREGFAADELVACAILGLRSLEPGAGAEILDHTRHPGYVRPGYSPTGPVTTGLTDVDMIALARLLGRDVDEEAVREWLAEQGLEVGCKYSHDRCPADPQRLSHGEPVYVGDAGVYCHTCTAGGVTLGSRKPGWFPYAALVPGGFAPRLRSAAVHFCHWEHAQHLMVADTGLSGQLAECCFRGLLKLIHGPHDPRVAEVFRRGRGLVRMDGYWATDDLARAHSRDGLTERLARLPAVLRPDPGSGDNPLVVDSERLGIFRGVDDLTKYGYPRLQPARGISLAHQLRPNLDNSVVHAIVPSDALRDERLAQFRPRYLTVKKRMSMIEAQQIICTSFPGISIEYLKLLIAGRGFTEVGAGQQPMIAVDGPSGSGKSTTVAVAATILGDNYRAVAWNPNAEYFHQKLYEASTSAGLVCSDEIIKLAKSKNGDVLSGLNSLLTFTQGCLVRKLYTGPVLVRYVPVIVITDIAFPREVILDQQIGRRFIYVHLDRRVEWQRSAKNISNWRALSRENAAAADAFLSTVIDEYFSDDDLPVFEEIAANLGFQTLSHASEVCVDSRADLIALYRACCDAAAVAATGSTWKGRGWKLIKRTGADPLSQRWQGVCDDLGDGFISSRRVKEADWAEVLGSEEAVECDYSENGKSTLAIRFRCGDPRSPKLRVNEEIKSPPRDDEPQQQPAHSPPAMPRPAVPAVPDAALSRVEAPPSAIATAAPIFIDLETRSPSDLKKVGGRRYAAHPDTEVLSVVALLGDAVVVWIPLLDKPLSTDGLWPEGYGFAPLPVHTFVGQQVPEMLAEVIRSGRPLCAHNAFDFDLHVWRAKGLPEPTNWLDTLPHARAGGLPGKLDELGERLLGKGKDKEGAALVKKLCRPDSRGRFVPFTIQRAFQLARYNLADVLLLARVYEVAYGCGEPDVVALDRTINDRGVAFDVALAEGLVALEARATETIKAGVERLTEGAIKASDLRRDKFVQNWLRSRGVQLPNLQKATVQLHLASGAVADAAVRSVLEARLAANRITAGKLDSALAACDPDGRQRGMLVYHQALTGRWAGRRMQPHNLPRPHKLLKDPLPLLEAVKDPERFQVQLPPTVGVADGIAALIRPCLRAAPGKYLCMVDFASIEARGVAWCAGEESLLARFARGDDVYLDLASRVFGRTLSRKDEAERQVGKQAILGCGYGMGEQKFADTCTRSGVNLAAAGTSASAVVEGYRNAYPAIAGVIESNGNSWRQGGLWRDLEAAARKTVLSGNPNPAGRCQFSMDGTTLLIQLPSGRHLYYREARIEKRVPGYCRTRGLPEVVKPTIIYDHPKHRDTQLYGGKLAENIVQAICRDLLVAAMLDCQRQGLPVVLHVHDEIVIEVDQAEAEQALRRLATIMSMPPAWATGFPIEVEGFGAERYLKGAPRGAPVVKARNGQIL